MGKINEHGQVQRDRRSIYEFGNSELLLSVSDDIVPGLKRCFPYHWKEVLALIRARDPKPIRYMKSAWEKLYASLLENTMKDFVENTMPYLREYHQRNLSESKSATDKKMLGWNIAQRREDRIDNALFCTGLWHILFNVGRL